MSQVTEESEKALTFLKKLIEKLPLYFYVGLIPKADKFMFNDGAHRDMVNIYGTIPVPYKVRKAR